MRFITTIILLFAAFVSATGCSSDAGPDAISQGGAQGGPGGGATITTCTTVCHVPGGAVGPDPLATNGSGTAGKHVAHVTSLGLACSKCHFNYENNPSHFNGTVNVKGNGTAPVYFDATNPAGVWSYVAPSGTCSSTICHRSLSPDWYGTAVPPQDPVCANCHGAAVGARRQVLGTGGDFATDLAVTSHHVTGASDPVPAQCTVCHDQSVHMGGTVRLRNADTGAQVVYNPQQPSTLEPFCVSCHDADGALATTTTATGLDPFNDGSTLGTMPYAAGVTIAGSWNGSSTHRSRGLTCAGSGAVNTGCHGRSGAINAHGSANKGLLTNSMNFQIPLESQATYSVGRSAGGPYDVNNYRLCFDCHAAYPSVAKEVVFGFLTGGVYDIFKEPTPFGTGREQSGFRDYFNGTAIPFYSDTMWGDTYLALHNYHMLGFESQAILVPAGTNALQWKYRGDPAMTGRITCTACHNVHGTTAATVRSTHEALGLTRFVNGSDVYVILGVSLLPGDFLNAPMNCAIDCHGPAGQTSYWKVPARE